ncbi:unnamed protein product [Rotaria sordida]|uniref:Uncharacterized protein n=1 Tax=Rotaria sordida TaxID=392033 RepID=A0A819P9W1_9BILA|nr:unnamed protein product [Rotaria sordida]CAF4017325.1 unnamed protein product [Rotaria sordida]
MVFFQRHEFGFEDKSVSTTIPNNDVARLMYYLHCACYTIEYDDMDVSRNNSNKIFEISQVSHQLLAAQSVIIAG